MHLSEFDPISRAEDAKSGAWTSVSEKDHSCQCKGTKNSVHLHLLFFCTLVITCTACQYLPGVNRLFCRPIGWWKRRRFKQGACCLFYGLQLNANTLKMQLQIFSCICKEKDLETVCLFSNILKHFLTLSKPQILLVPFVPGCLPHQADPCQFVMPATNAVSEHPFNAVRRRRFENECEHGMTLNFMNRLLNELFSNISSASPNSSFNLTLRYSQLWLLQSISPDPDPDPDPETDHIICT